MASMILNGTEYELATTLRVAYKLQGQHNHKPYIEIFQSVGSMGLEKQIGILFAAFDTANPGVLQQTEFLNTLLDTYNLQEMMDVLQEVIAGMMGTTPEAMQAQLPTGSNLSQAGPPPQE